jgi:hypothetical protein
VVGCFVICMLMGQVCLSSFLFTQHPNDVESWAFGQHCAHVTFQFSQPTRQYHILALVLNLTRQRLVDSLWTSHSPTWHTSKGRLIVCGPLCFVSQWPTYELFYARPICSKINNRFVDFACGLPKASLRSYISYSPHNNCNGCWWNYLWSSTNVTPIRVFFSLVGYG